MTAAVDAILFDADGVVQTTDQWWYALSALVRTDDEEQVKRFLHNVVIADLSSPAGRRPYRRPLGEMLERWGVTTPADESGSCGNTSMSTPASNAHRIPFTSAMTRCSTTCSTPAT